MSYFLAVDAGGTKTQCWIADDERVLGRASGGTVKLMLVGEEAATKRLQDLVQKAGRNAGVDLREVKRTCMGLAGISSQGVREWADRELRNLLPGEVLLCGDEQIALDAAFHGGPGVLVIAGTGSVVVGRCSDGMRTTAGGWGPLVGDEGSGTWIGLQGVRTALRALDRGDSTSLLDAVQEFWGLESVGELLAKANNRPRPDFAELVATVVRCALDGDAVAQAVLDRAGEELAHQVELVISKMQRANCADGDCGHVAFTGSVLGRIPQVRSSMRAALQRSCPATEVAQEAVEPLDGALWHARNC